LKTGSGRVTLLKYNSSNIEWEQDISGTNHL
jgi:hypothetical protein